MKRIRSTTLWVTAFALNAFIFPVLIASQSTDPNFPTALTINEIDGTIKARDIGDGRLTSYFYTFDGGQGDVFVNVVTKNFSGDIDVFAAEGLRPLTKMVIYADAGVSETGRLIYLRKPERLILRVEGRSPNDDPATFKIKFAGSFIALAGQKQQDTPVIKGSDVDPESGIRVNSVGTIIEVITKPPPPAKERPVAKETVSIIAAPKDKKAEPAKGADVVKNPPAPVAAAPKKTVSGKDPTGKAKEKTPGPANGPANGGSRAGTGTKPKKDAAPATSRTTEPPAPKTVFNRPAKPKSTPAAEKAPAKTTKPAEANKPDPLASIRLVVQLKDGTVIERPMSEVQKFSVDKGQLTVIVKDGGTFKYSILDVAKVTIE